MCYLRGGYVYSRGLFLPNVPGATFIQGGTFIPESRVACRVLHGNVGPVYLLQVSKNDDEKRCFLK